MRLHIGSLLAISAAMLFLSTVAARADDQPAATGTPADSCPASAGGIAATNAGGTALRAGASVIVRDSASPRLTVTVPGSFGVVAQPGDKASFITANGSTQISWTLADGASPYRYLNLTSAGTVRRVVTALYLRGLTPCVQSAAGVDELDLKLPHNLGTARFTATGNDWSSIAVSAGSDADTLALAGTLHALDLAHSSLTLSARANGALSQIGTVAFSPNGLESGLVVPPVPVDIGTPLGSLKIVHMSFKLVPGSGSHVTVGFVPPLPASLPFTLTPVDVELLAGTDGTVTSQCAGNATATSTAPILGTAPNITLKLGGPASPIVLNCEGGRFTKLSGTVAITWPSVTAAAPGTTTSFTFVAGEGGLHFTPLDGALPSLQFAALGLDASVTSPTLSGTGSELVLAGQIALSLRFAPGFPTAQGGVNIAIRPPGAGGQPTFALQCGAPATTTKKAGTIVLEPDCDGSEIDGVKTDGGTIALPDAVGAGSIAIPKFRVVRGKLDAASDLTCVPAGTAATSPRPFLKFGNLSVASCSLGYDGSTGMKLTVGGSVALPDYVIAKGTKLNVANVVIGYRASSKKYGVLSLDASLMPEKDQALHLFGMDVDAYTDTRPTAVACKDGALLRAKSSDVDGVAEALKLTLCAQARLPEYLSFESKPRVGLLKDGVIQPQASRPAMLFFRGLEFGPDGIEKPAPEQLSDTTDCDKPSGLAGHETAQVLYDCRASGGYDKPLTMGPLSLSDIKLYLVGRVMDARDKPQYVPGNAPQFHFAAGFAFAKYLSSDNTDGQLTADFDHKHMVLLGEFKKPASVHAGVVTLGLQSFEMDLDASQRKFVATGASVGETTGVNTTALYFKSITFLETNEGSGWHLKKLSAPIDTPKTLLGFAYRLFSDLGATSFLHWFGLR